MLSEGVALHKVRCESLTKVLAQAFELRVRPALDSVGSAVDRCKMAIYTAFAAYGLPCPVTGKSSGNVTDQGFSRAHR